MAQHPTADPRGSYDDVPDGPVRTVLNVPLDPPGGESNRTARHRGGHPSPAPGRRKSVLWSTIRVGALAALVVLAATGLTMVALVWQP